MNWEPDSYIIHSYAPHSLLGMLNGSIKQIQIANDTPSRDRQINQLKENGVIRIHSFPQWRQQPMDTPERGPIHVKVHEQHHQIRWASLLVAYDSAANELCVTKGISPGKCYDVNLGDVILKIRNDVDTRQQIVAYVRDQSQLQGFTVANFTQHHNHFREQFLNYLIIQECHISLIDWSELFKRIVSVTLRLETVWQKEIDA